MLPLKVVQVQLDPFPKTPEEFSVLSAKAKASGNGSAMALFYDSSCLFCDLRIVAREASFTLLLANEMPMLSQRFCLLTTDYLFQTTHFAMVLTSFHF